MSYHVAGLGAQDPFKLFETKLAELREGKAEEAAGTRPPSPLSTIPGQCWDQPGFKDCHAVAFRAAQADCQAQGKLAEGNKCIGPLADHYAINACPCERESDLLAGLMGNGWLVAGIGLVGAFLMFGKKKAKAS